MKWKTILRWEEKKGKLFSSIKYMIKKIEKTLLKILGFFESHVVFACISTFMFI